MSVIEKSIFFPIGKMSHIAYVENAINKKTCSEIMSLGEEVFDRAFYPGPTVSGVDKKMKNCFDWPLCSPDERYTEEEIQRMKRLDGEVFSDLAEALHLYVEEYDFLKKFWVERADTNYQVQKYLKGDGFYDAHVDGGPWAPGTLNKRVLAVVIYLNTVKEGGGTKFRDHEVTIDAVAGRASIFPAYWTHPHGGEVPISEDKWIISTFLVVGN
jgi:hypothetical protein